MPEEASNYAGHDFAELITTNFAQAESISMMLRSHAVDARTVQAGGWTIGGPSEQATVLVPRPDLDTARAHLRLEMSHQAAIETDEQSRAHATCTACGYSLAGHSDVGTCPECGQAYAHRPPVVSKKLREKRERAKAIAAGLLVAVILTYIMSHGAHRWF